MMEMAHWARGDPGRLLLFQRQQGQGCQQTGASSETKSDVAGVSCRPGWPGGAGIEQRRRLTVPSVCDTTHVQSINRVV
jgi:hypothetical protein